MNRFVEIWNGIPGNAEVTKFQNRKKAVARIWKAIQPLVDKAQPSEPAAKPKKAARGAKPTKKAKAVKKVAKVAKPSSAATRKPKSSR